MITRVCLLCASALAASSLLGHANLCGQERFSLSSNRIAIYNVAGEVRVERGSGSNVVVEVTRGGDDRGRLDIDRRELDGWQTLIVRYPENTVIYRGLGRFSRTEFSIDDRGLFGLSNLDPARGSERVTAKAEGDHHGERMRVKGSGAGLEAHADLRILVPEGKAVALHLGVGHVSVSGVSADVQVDAYSGSASSERTHGFLRMDTGSGSVHVADAAGDIALNTGSGGVKAITLRGGVLKVHTGSGSVDLSEVAATEASISTGSGGVTAVEITSPTLAISTGSGGIRAQRVGASKFDLHTGSGSITLGLDSDVQVGRVRTGSGGVTISTSRGIGADVTLDTGSGGIDIDIPFDVFERRRSFVHGSIGDGKGTLDVSTGSGSISLR